MRTGDSTSTQTDARYRKATDETPRIRCIGGRNRTRPGGVLYSLPEGNGRTGTVMLAVPMNSSDTVLVKLERGGGIH
jgi:hypothetical protein